MWIVLVTGSVGLTVNRLTKTYHGITMYFLEIYQVYDSLSLVLIWFGLLTEASKEKHCFGKS